MQHVRKSGSLVVAWTPEQKTELPQVLIDNKEAGDQRASLLTQEQLRELEPSLSDKALGAVFCPYEVISEPWLVAMGYAENALLNGVKIKLKSRVTKTTFNKDHWTIKLNEKETIKAKTVINCAGLYGD